MTNVHSLNTTGINLIRDKNGTKLVENISCDILSRCPRYQRPLLFFCKGTQLLRDKRRESPKSFICSTFFFNLYRQWYLWITKKLLSVLSCSCIIRDNGDELIFVQKMPEKSYSTQV